MIEVEVNGETQQLPSGATLEQLLERMALTEQRLAIELNLQVIPRSRFGQVELQSRDRVEIVHAIGGG
ncbi:MULTISPECIES: sulfur carrier protein ThiS [Motiliproteus]|uniref:sulfur carrier protein ThiS n=1 Tax=Motiliproteus TaxID=1775292 RepID=UPI001FB3C590|nr:sulfur carrier protein ThiS [Motiliproteus coralliicola]